MKISHLIPENSSYEGIFCSFQTLVVPFKPLVGRSNLCTLMIETWILPDFFLFYIQPMASHLVGSSSLPTLMIETWIPPVFFIQPMASHLVGRSSLPTLMIETWILPNFFFFTYNQWPAIWLGVQISPRLFWRPGYTQVSFF
jgi:hypothetical protein